MAGLGGLTYCKGNCLDALWTGCGKIDEDSFDDKMKELLRVQICQIQLKQLHVLVFFMCDTFCHLGVTTLPC